MVVKTAQEIFLNFGPVTLVLAPSMETGHPGLNGVIAARHVQMGQDLATELAVVPFHSLVEETVLDK